MLNFVDPVSLDPGSLLVLVIHLETHGNTWHPLAPGLSLESPRPRMHRAVWLRSLPHRVTPSFSQDLALAISPPAGPENPLHSPSRCKPIFQPFNSPLQVPPPEAEMFGGPWGDPGPESMQACLGKARRKWDRKFPAPSLSGKGIKRFLRINPLRPSLGEVGKRAGPEKSRRSDESRLQLCLRVKLL